MSEFEDEVFLQGIDPNEGPELEKYYDEDEDEDDDEYSEFYEDFDDD